jgi:hypothetical protein
MEVDEDYKRLRAKLEKQIKSEVTKNGS